MTPDLDNAIRATAKAHARPILGWDVQRWCEAQGKRVPPMDDVIAAIKRMFAQGELVYDAGRGFALRSALPAPTSRGTVAVPDSDSSKDAKR